MARGMNWCPSHDWDPPDDDWGQFEGQFAKAMLDLNEGRNLDDYPLISFGGKDADLLPEGCSGIRESTKIDEDHGVTVEVGIHKTYSWDEEWTEEQRDIAHECLPHIQGSKSEGDSEGWEMSLTFDVTVPWIWKPDGESESEDIDAMVADCIKRVKAELKPIEEELALADSALTAITADEISKGGTE